MTTCNVSFLINVVKYYQSSTIIVLHDSEIIVTVMRIIFRFYHDVFDRVYKATIGVDFETEKFSYSSIRCTPVYRIM